MARQVGFAIGIALFVAVFTGSIDDERRQARERIAGLPAPVTRAESLEIVRDEVRDAYGRAFAAGGIVVVLAVPFSLTMRRRPADVHRGSEAAAAAAG